MPRNRTVRVAVLGSSVERTAASRHALRNATALKRRVVVGVLLVLSLLMITLYFRESQSGGLHTLQDAGATALRPFQVAAERVARPFRDAYDYVTTLTSAKSENDRLRAEVARLRQEAAQFRGAWEENKHLRELADYKTPARYPDDYEAVRAAVVSRPSSVFEQWVIISAGSAHGIQLNDPVMSPRGGLVGVVTQVAPSTAQVTLLTDGDSAVSAEILSRDATGLLLPGRAGSGMLALDLVKKKFLVRRGDEVVTGGSRVGELGSLYPRNIAIGRVSYVSQDSTDLYKTIQVEPHVDFDTLRSVSVLVPRRGPAER